MFRPFRVAGAALRLAMPLLASCGDEGVSQIAVSDAWARASVTATGAAYLTVSNSGDKDDLLLEVRSRAAEKVEIHDMTMDGMVMKMRRLDALPVAAGESVALAPGGKHIMLIGLVEPLSEGMTVPLTLVVESAGEIEVSAPVRPAGQMAH